MSDDAELAPSPRGQLASIPALSRGRRRTSVAQRVLLSYALITLAFTLVAGWSTLALRSASREAELMRSGYLPLTRALRDLVANQDTWNSQLNHVTTARNPADIQIWFETALRLGRPKKLQEVRAALAKAFLSSEEPGASDIGRPLLSELESIEAFLQDDALRVSRLFDALTLGNDTSAEEIRDELVTRGFLATRRMTQLDQRVLKNVDGLLFEARAREALALRLLLLLAVLTVGVGIAVAVYARRMLRPLTLVTRRAQAVAEGDLTLRSVVASNDEIGELASTFEAMVSAIAQANEQLLTSERLATIGKMAAHVTHEIRNPLSSIGLNVELLEEEMVDEARESRALLHAIKTEVERLAALSEQYLSVARQQRLQLEEEDLGQIVREAHDFIAPDLERHGVTTRIDVAPELPTVRVDEAQIKQALFNVIRNAREAMPRGGLLSVSVRTVPGRAEILVDDEGEGIDEVSRERLFEPFFTTKGHGTGLGLAITRQIVQGHGGSVACERAPGGGTRFTLRLPVSEGTPDDEHATE